MDSVIGNYTYIASRINRGLLEKLRRNELTIMGNGFTVNELILL